MGEKAVWDDVNVKHFIDICKEEIDAGNRPIGCFNGTGWKSLINVTQMRTIYLEWHVEWNKNNLITFQMGRMRIQ